MSIDTEKLIQEEEVYRHSTKTLSSSFVPEFTEPGFENCQKIIDTLGTFWSLPYDLQHKVACNLEALFRASGTSNIPSLLPTILKIKSNYNREVEVSLCRSLVPILKILQDRRHFTQKYSEAVNKASLQFLLDCLSENSDRLRLAAFEAIKDFSKFWIGSESLILPCFLNIFGDNDNFESQICAVELVPCLCGTFSKKTAEGTLIASLIPFTTNSNQDMRLSSIEAIFSLVEHHKFGSKRIELLQIARKTLDEGLKAFRLIPRIILALARTGPPIELEKELLPAFLCLLMQNPQEEETIRCLGPLLIAMIESGQEAIELRSFTRLHKAFYDLPTKGHRGALAFSESFGHVARPKMIKDWVYSKKAINVIGDQVNSSFKLAKLNVVKNLPLIAKKLTPEQIEKELLPLILEKILNETEAKTIAFSSLPSVLMELHPTTRESYAEIFVSLVAEPGIGWRPKDAALNSILTLSKLFSKATRNGKIILFFFELMKDDCAFVRKKATGIYWNLYDEVRTNEEAKNRMRGTMITFGRLPNYIHRLSFVGMIEGVIFNALHLLDADMARTCVSLAKDKIINVVIRVGMLLCIVRKKDPFSKPSRPDLLQSDPRHPDHWAQSGAWISDLSLEICGSSNPGLVELQKEIQKSEVENNQESGISPGKTTQKRSSFQREKDLYEKLRKQEESEQSETTSNAPISETIIETEGYATEEIENMTESMLDSNINEENFEGASPSMIAQAKKSKEKMQQSDQVVRVSKGKRGNTVSSTKDKMKKLKKANGEPIVIMTQGSLFRNVNLKEEYNFDEDSEKLKKMAEVRMSKTYNVFEKATMQVKIDNISFNIEKKIEEVPEEAHDDGEDDHEEKLENTNDKNDIN